MAVSEGDSSAGSWLWSQCRQKVYDMRQRSVWDDQILRIFGSGSSRRPRACLVKQHDSRVPQNCWPVYWYVGIRVQSWMDPQTTVHVSRGSREVISAKPINWTQFFVFNCSYHRVTHWSRPPAHQAPKAPGKLGWRRSMSG